MGGFEPYVYVEHSLRLPTSITAAAFTGAPWRFVAIPEPILRRDAEEQLGWVSWKARTHYRESGGKCLLFGSIISYRWQCSPDESIRLDVRGRIIAALRESFTPASGTIAVGKKSFFVRGTWQVTPAARRCC